MITAALSVFALLSVSGLFVMFAAARQAPVGFEDENGFHVIDEPARQTAVLASPVSLH